ncbi:MAG: B12-binding domain-containing radical SAM protein [Chloroflexi bacterium]|nr:B12-binding domain-containing radical SAM protein [Chloroflexota bacterium]
MKVLLVYPEYPATFWSLKGTLRVFGKKATLPPLGLLTVAAMLPADWEKKLIDTNVTALTDEDIRWADYVFVSAVVVQRDSAKEVIRRCKALDAKIVAGGPLFTSESEEFEQVDHLVLNEAEVTLPSFIADLERGCAKRVYSSSVRPEITKTPIPMWSLIDLQDYAQVGVQYSRGCPFDCEFCDVIVLFGREVRTKTTQQFIDEFEALYQRGWRGFVFIVDDNFVANRGRLKRDVLPALIKWQAERSYPFNFFTQASINMADDDDLIRMMVQAGFESVFVGIETINEESLAEAHKNQNRHRDLVAAVKKLQSNGLHVLGGFIVGFDSDNESIFEEQRRFIQESGIAIAMVGMLQAPRDTRLYHRLKSENRLLSDFAGDVVSSSVNFIPKMGNEALLKGYRTLLNSLYAPKPYYQRVGTLLREFQPKWKAPPPKLSWRYVRMFFKLVWVLGVADRARWHTLRFLTWNLFTRPRLLPLALVLTVYELHFRSVVRKISEPGRLSASA